MSGKSDLDRLGLFKEMSYHIGKPYEPPLLCPFNEDAHKGKQMETVGFNTKDGTSAGYFSPFLRPFEGEEFTDPMQTYRREKRRSAAKQITPQVFRCPNPPGKMRYGLGTHIGTFSGPVSSFSPVVEEKKKMPTLVNFLLSFPKKGSGYQYANVGINSFPPYISTDYDAPRKAYKKDQDFKELDIPFQPPKHPRFFNENPWQPDERAIKLLPREPKEKPPQEEKRDQSLFRPLNPGKKPGGMKAGCFTPFSDYATEFKGVRTSYQKPPLNGPFHASAEKSTPTFVSVIQHNVKSKVNRKTYQSIQGVVYNL